MEDAPLNDMDYVLINQLSNISQDISEFESIENSNLLNMNFLNLNDINISHSHHNDNLNVQMNQLNQLNRSKIINNGYDSDLNDSIKNYDKDYDKDINQDFDRDLLDYNDDVATQATTPENSLTEFLNPVSNEFDYLSKDVSKYTNGYTEDYKFNKEFNKDSNKDFNKEFGKNMENHIFNFNPSINSNSNTINPKKLLSNDNLENSIITNLSFQKDLLVNDECFNAISYWLNNQTNDLSIKIPVLSSNKPNSNQSTNKLKSHYRRNSIQVTQTNDLSYITKDKKRRKSISITTKPKKFNERLNENIEIENNLNLDLKITKSTEIDSKIEKSIKLNQLNQLNEEEDYEKPFNCPDCTKQFKRSEHLKRHIRSVHSNIRPFHCKYCEKKFSRSDNLAQHLKTHKKLSN